MSTQEFTSNQTVQGNIFWGETIPGDEYYSNDSRVKPNILDSVLTRGNKKVLEQLQKGDFYNVEYQQGRTLNRLATEYIGNSFAWQVIADANGIEPNKPIDIAKLTQSGIKIPDSKVLEQSIKKFIINSPQGKQLINDVENSILNLVGVGENRQDEFSKGLRECVKKIVNFKFDAAKLQ